MANQVHGLFITTLLLALALASALPAQYYTEFQVSAPDSPTLLADVYALLAEFCQGIPLLCSAPLNVSVAGS